MGNRIKKVNELIKHEAAKALERENISGFVTVKAVETTRDMKYSLIWVSIIGDNQEDILEEIQDKRHDVQMVVASKMTSRHVPRIEFKLDLSGDHAQRIEELLRNDTSASSK